MTRRSTGPRTTRASPRWLTAPRAGSPTGGRFEGGQKSVQDPAIARLVVTSAGASSPAWNRLAEITKERMAGS
jgi:hypothetical protein